MPEFDKEGIYLDLEDRRNAVDEWIDDDNKKYMCRSCLPVIRNEEYEVVKMIFGLTDDEPNSYNEIADIMNMNKRKYRESIIKLIDNLKV